MIPDSDRSCRLRPFCRSHMELVLPGRIREVRQLPPVGRQVGPRRLRRSLGEVPNISRFAIHDKDVPTRFQNQTVSRG